MRDRPPRMRPLLIVLVPAILLAVLAGRAVLEETRAEESRARNRGHEAATRLARSVRSIVAEYTASLTEAPGGAAADGSARPAFLRPAFLYDAALASAEPADLERYRPSAAAGAFVGDALDAADSLGDDAAGLEAAAILLRALAAAAPSPAAAESLQFAANVRDPQLAAAAGRRRLDGFEDIARNAPGLPESVRVRLVEDVDAILGDRVPGQVRDERRRWEGLRDVARRAAAENRAIVAMAPRPGGVALVLAAPAAEGRIAGGEVPPESLRERLAAESDALSAEPGFVSVHLISPGGQRAFGASEPATGDVLVEAMPLDAPLDDWRAEAVLTRPRGVPGSALLLAAAFIGAAATLAWGVFLLHRAAERQARLAAERQSFLDHVAHEVRTPSAALLALGEELAGGHVPPERRGVYEGHIVTEARRLARLVDDTLDLSRLDAGRLVFERAPSDLRIIARNGVEAAAATERTKLELADAPVVAVADPAALARVVRNLVDNAIRHGGSSAPVVVRVATEGGDAVVSVADRGSGIDAAVRARLFERFHRKTGETHETKGVGIGLALCREIVEAHGGTISVDETAPGARDPGTTFTLRFPSHPAAHNGGRS